MKVGTVLRRLNNNFANDLTVVTLCQGGVEVRDPILFKEHHNAP